MTYNIFGGKKFTTRNRNGSYDHLSIHSHVQTRYPFIITNLNSSNPIACKIQRPRKEGVEITMAGGSRWADDETDRAEDMRRKQEKEDKKRARLAKQHAEQEAVARAKSKAKLEEEEETGAEARPAKRRRLSGSGEKDAVEPVQQKQQLLRFEAGGWGSCRHVGNFETLNHIEEGSYGWVSRAREAATGEVVALKKVKMDYVNDGFPITALREIAMLQKARHKNVVDLREVVMGDAFDEYVYGKETCQSRRRPLMVYQSSTSHGVPRARPQDTARRHARALPRVRSQDADPPTRIRSRFPA
jgi:hypothetical protein